jgi:DNA-binding FadR family transcriptional regulator
LYVPGDKLPSQRELAKSLGVSMATLREAVRVLEAEGYVSLRRGATGGAFVLENREREDVLLQRLHARLDEFDEWMDFREAVEAASAKLAATRASSGELEELEATVEALRGHPDQPGFRAADSSFHLGLAQAAHNQFVLGAVRDARAAFFNAFDGVRHVFNEGSTLEWHERILAAVAAGEPRAAADAMGEHVRVAWQEIRTTIEESLDQS